jgi:hypothetical protein
VAASTLRWRKLSSFCPDSARLTVRACLFFSLSMVDSLYLPVPSGLFYLRNSIDFFISCVQNACRLGLIRFSEKEKKKQLVLWPSS